MGIDQEDPVNEGTICRRERLMALRAAKDFASMPDEEPDETKPREDAPVVDGIGNDPQERINEVAEEDTIEQAAAARRDKIKALKMAKELLETPDEDKREPDETEDESKPNMKFRNYLPHDKQLQDSKLTPAALPKFEDPVTAAPPQPEKVEEDPFVNIAPKKSNWDLRRDVQKKLDKLEKRTQKALYQLMQEQEKEREAKELEESGVTEDQ